MFNIIGLVMCFMAMTVGALAQFIVLRTYDTDAGLSFLVGGALAALLDFGYRESQYRAAGLWRFVQPTTGGHAMFLPVWCCGLGVFLLGGWFLVTNRHGQKVERERAVRAAVEFLENTADDLQQIKGRAAWQAAQGRYKRCREKLLELTAHFKDMGDEERRRMEKIYGWRVNGVRNRLEREVGRLDRLPVHRPPEEVDGL